MVSLEGQGSYSSDPGGFPKRSVSCRVSYSVAELTPFWGFRTFCWPQHHVSPLVVGWCVPLSRSCSTILLRFTVMCISTRCFLHTGRYACWLRLPCLGSRARGGELRLAQTWCTLLLVPLLLLKPRIKTTDAYVICHRTFLK